MFKILEKFPNLITEISTKQDGSMGPFSTESSKEEKKNREKFLKQLGFSMESVVKAGMVHGGQAEIVSAKDKNGKAKGMDGLVTNEKNLLLAITSADCLPIFLFDSEKEIIGLAHAGWRGLAKNIISNTVEKMVELGATPKNILAAVGPGIGVCHYYIKDKAKEEMLEKFKPYLNEALVERENKQFLDFKKMAEIQLLSLGIKLENIEISSECTYDLKDKYFSYRRDYPEKVELMMAIMGMKKII